MSATLSMRDMKCKGSDADVTTSYKKYVRNVFRHRPNNVSIIKMRIKYNITEGAGRSHRPGRFPGSV